MPKLILRLIPLAAVLLIGCAAAHPNAAQKKLARANAFSTRRLFPRVASPPSDPDDAAPHDGEFIEYRYLSDLGKITISDQAVRGDKSVDYLESHSKQLSRKGIFVCAGDKMQFYRRSEKAGDHEVETVVVIEPPTGKGDSAEAAKQHVLVRVDGHIKVACSIGTSTDGEMWVGQVSIFPEDGTLEIVALSADGQELTLPEEWLSFDSPMVITDGSFFDDSGEMENPLVQV